MAMIQRYIKNNNNNNNNNNVYITDILINNMTPRKYCNFVRALSLNAIVENFEVLNFEDPTTSGRKR